MDFEKDFIRPSRMKAFNMLQVVRLARTQFLTTAVIRDKLDVSKSAAGAYLRAAADAGALVRVGEHHDVVWVESTDKDAIERFIEKMKTECGLPTRQQANARDMRRKMAEKEGRFIHYIDKAGQGPLEEVKPVSRDPFDALFFGTAKVAA